MATIIISGANQGIGYFLVKQLLEDGNKVAVLDLKTDNLCELSVQFKDSFLYYSVDMRQMENILSAVDEIVKVFHTVDVAVHNACRCTFESEADTDLTTYEDVMDVNYFGAMRLSKCVLPYMVKQHFGRVIFTGSGVGVTGFMNISPYASGKGAIESLAKCLRIEYAENNISFHIFHPPLTDTASSSGLTIPKEFKSDAQTVGRGLAKRIFSKKFVICHSLTQYLQMKLAYRYPLFFGDLMAKAAKRAGDSR